MTLRAISVTCEAKKNGDTRERANEAKADTETEVIKNEYGIRMCIISPSLKARTTGEGWWL